MNARKKTKRNRRASLATFVATYSDNNLEDGAAKKETIKTSAAEDRNKFANVSPRFAVAANRSLNVKPDAHELKWIKHEIPDLILTDNELADSLQIEYLQKYGKFSRFDGKQIPYVSSYGKAAAEDYLETNSTGKELSYEEQMAVQIAELNSKRNVTLYGIASELHDMNNFYKLWSQRQAALQEHYRNVRNDLECSDILETENQTIQHLASNLSGQTTHSSLKIRKGPLSMTRQPSDIFNVNALYFQENNGKEISQENEHSVREKARLRDMVRKNLETEHIEDGNYMKFLMNVSALRQLSRKELEVLNAACVKEYFEAGKRIIYEGDVKCEKFYIIIKGSVKITKINKESPEMEEEEVGRLGSSQCFGERALLSSERRTASVYADENVTLLSLSREIFEKVISGHAHLIGALYSDDDNSVSRDNLLLYTKKYTDVLAMKLEADREQNEALFLKSSLYVELLKVYSPELGPQDVIERIMENLTTFFCAERCGLFLYDKNANPPALVLLVDKTSKGLRLPVKGIAGAVALSGNIENIPRAYKDPRFNREVDKKTGFRTRSILAAPVFSNKHGEKEVCAVIQVINKRIAGTKGWSHFGSKDEVLIQGVAEQLASVFESNSQFVRTLNMNTDISSAYIDSPLTITVIGLEGTTKQRDPCFVSVELWHGLHMLEKKETAVSKQLLVGPKDGMQWQAKVVFSLNVNELPKATRAVFKVMSVKSNTKGYQKPSSWAGIMMYDYSGRLVSGSVKLRTWSGIDFEPANSASMVVDQTASGGLLSIFFDSVSHDERSIVHCFQKERGETYIETISSSRTKTLEASEEDSLQQDKRNNENADGRFSDDDDEADNLFDKTTMNSNLENQVELLLVDPRKCIRSSYGGRDAHPALAVVKADLLEPMVEAEKSLIWEHRQSLVLIPAALPKVVLAVDYTKVEQVMELHRLLSMWQNFSATDALPLLGPLFADPTVRSFAVSQLDKFTDEEMCIYMLQLTNSLRHEPYHDSALSRLLIRRALRNPDIIGHVLYWNLRSSLNDSFVRTRNTIVLQIYLMHVEDIHRLEFGRQLYLVSRLKDLSKRLTEIKSLDRKRRYIKTGLQELTADKFFKTYQLPLSPNFICKNINIKKCRVMDSKQVPLWLNFDAIAIPKDLTTEETRTKSDFPTYQLQAMFKVGDDLRQDQLTIQILRVMDQMWKKRGMDLLISPYSVVPTGNEEGFIEIVENSKTVAGIVKTGNAEGIFLKKLRIARDAMFKTSYISDWLSLQNNNHGTNWNFESVQTFDTQTENLFGKMEKEKPRVGGGRNRAGHKATKRPYYKRRFMRSCAGYCVATYVLGLGDRHNDNIMVTRDGRLFHIDFGHFLGNFKSKFGYKRERESFVFTPAFASVMDGVDSPMFQEFLETCGQAYNVLRENSILLLSLLQLMISAGIPELKSSKDIMYMREKLMLHLSEHDASKHFEKEIFHNMKSTKQKVNDAAHLIRRS